MQQFNPYHEWLGLDPELTSPNHYQLLGVDANERDDKAIQHAADVAMSRVRQFRPGDRARDWARLLDELKEAKRCLSDVETRREYDRQLNNPASQRSTADTPFIGDPSVDYAPGGSAQQAFEQTPRTPPTAATSPAPASPAYQAYGDMRSTTPATPSNPPMAKLVSPLPSNGNSTGVPANHPEGQPAAALPGQPAPAGYGSAPTSAFPTGTAYSPNSNYGSSNQFGLHGMQSPATAMPAFDPMAPYDPNQAESFGTAASAQPVPTGATNWGTASPSTNSLPVGTTVSPARQAAVPSVGSAQSAAKSARSRAKQGRHLPLVFAIAALMIAVTGGVLYVNLSGTPTNDPEASSQLAKNTTLDPTTVTSVSTNSQETKPRVEPAPASDPTLSKSTSSTLPKPTTDNEAAEPKDSATPETPAMTTVETTNPLPPNESTKPTEPEPVPPVPSDPPPEVMAAPMPATEPAPEPTPKPEPVVMPTLAEVQSLAKALTTARDALSEMNFEVADAELAKAEALAKLPAHHDKLERLKQLTHYVKEFRTALEEAIKGFTAGQTIPITESTQVGIVEPNPNMLVIRVAGVNRRYTMNELPLGLAVALADQWLDANEPSTKLVRGAYVVVHKRASDDNIAKARGWWEEAAASGLTQARDLMPVIDDRYDNLEADVK